MKSTQEKLTALLVTDDPAVEKAARHVAKDLGDILQLLRTKDEATCLAFDAGSDDTVAILDVDATFGTRAMFNTVAGMVSTIAVTGHDKPWLRAMLRQHRICATLSKPVSLDALRDEVRRIRSTRRA